MQITITRTLLSLSDLVIANATADTYQFGEFTGTGVQWERNTVTSPWIHGRRLRSSRKSSAELHGQFYVVSARDATPTAHDQALGVLLDALSQFTYTLSIQSTDGSNTRVWQYTCEPADVEPGDNESMMMNAAFRWTTLDVTIPHRPIPSSGAW